MKIKDNKNTEEYYFEEGCYIRELWNENTDEDVSVAQARVNPGESTKKHALKNTIERYLILKGEADVFIGDKKGQSVKANDVVIIPAGETQFITNTSEKDLIFLAICSPRFNIENYREVN